MTQEEQEKAKLEAEAQAKLKGKEGEDKKVKKHPTLGEYVKVKVIYKQPNKETALVFCGINNYSADFKQDTEVEIPKEAANFLKAATYVHHFYDATLKKHSQEDRKKYLVEFITE